MNHSTNIKDFILAISSEAMETIDAESSPRAIQIPLDMLISKFQILNPEIVGINSGYVFRYIKSIAKKNMYIDTTTIKKRNSRSHYVILHSDKSLTQSEMVPIIIQHETDDKIQFISDMIRKSIISSETPTEIPSSLPPFPLLHSFGINTTFESNKNQLVNLMSELVSLFRKSNEPMTFIHRGNDRPGLLVAIPKAKNYVTFDKNERKNKWLEEIMHFIDNEKSNHDEIWYWLLKQIYKKKPHVLIKMATDVGLVICHKMTDIEASAMWVEANISVRASRIILRHLQAKFGKRLQVPFTQISLLSNVTATIQPTFGEYEYRKDKNNEKVAEIMKYWTIDPIDLLELDFGRLLSSSQNQTIFGYESKVFQPSRLGVYAIIGADHGGGKSRYVLRVNYLPSSVRRKEGKVDFGTRTIQFAEVACKKDVHHIQGKIAPIVNKAIKQLESSLLVAIRIENIVICKFLPIGSTNMRCSIDRSDMITLCYCTQNSGSDIHLNIKVPSTINLERSPPIQLWTVIQCFKVVIAGDLSFFATSTGRDGHSSVRCVYCDSSSSEWNVTLPPSANKMTLSKLNHYADIYSCSSCPKKLDTKGVIMKPLFNIEPEFYIVPLLHLLIGIVNKLWSSFILFLDEFVEKTTLIETNLKISIDQCKIELNEMNCTIEILTVHKQMACVDYADSHSTESKEIIDSCRVELKTYNERKKNKNAELKN